MRIPRHEFKKARIEIIPMIDTIFFLLVYFMVASLAMLRMPSHRVRMPVSRTARERPSSRVIVTLSRDGTVYLDERLVADRDLVPALRDRLSRDPGAAVVINCDRGQTMGRFSRLFDRVKQADPAVVMVATSPAAPGPVPP